MRLYIQGGSGIITPNHPVPLINNSRHSGMLRKMYDDLEINVVILEYNGERIAIVTLDLLYVGSVLTQSIRSRICDLYEILPKNILITASHTHFAPSTDPAKPKLGSVNAAYLQKVVKKSDQVIDAVCAQVPVEAGLAWGQEKVGASIHRRFRWPWSVLKEGKVGWTVLKASNPFGPIDPMVRVLVVTDKNKTPQAILWGYACHPVGFPDHDGLTAEFPGVVRKHLRACFGQSVPIVFLQGFCGDLRPRLFPQLSLRKLFTLINRGPWWGAFVDIKAWRAWADTIASAVERAVLASESMPIGRGFACAMSDIPPERFLVNWEGAPELRIQALRLGEDCVLLGVSAEPSVEYALSLSKYSARVNWIPVGYCGDVFGYLPTETQRCQGGYEGDEYLSRVCSYGPLRPGLNKIWDQEMRSIMGRLDDLSFHD